MRERARTSQGVAIVAASVIVLNYNDSKATIRCVRSLCKHSKVELDISVVDNGSDSSDFGALRKGIDEEQLIVTGKNLGFAGGVNFALRQILGLSPEYVLLLNNDTIVYDDFLSPLMKFMDDNPRVAVAGPIITDLDTGS